MRQVVVVEPSPLEVRVGEAEAERMHEMQDGARVRAQPDRIAGVAWDLRCDEDDVKQRGAPVRCEDWRMTPSGAAVDRALAWRPGGRWHRPVGLR